MLTKELSEKTDAEIILLYKNGNKEVFKELIDFYTPILYNFVARTTNKNDASDIIQEVFIKVWKNLERFDESKANFKTWIFTITRNTVIDFSRKKKSFLFSDMFSNTNENDIETENSFEENILSEEILPDEALQKLEDTEILNKTLEKLQKNYREILILYYQEEMTFEEIGKILNKSINTVKSQHRRVIIELRKILNSH
jgi:RNA polymerase sigma-70 factor (ECF subfamily)